jgi:hypothetical protein
MHNASHHDVETSVKEGYEITDMNTRLIGMFIAGLFVLMFGSVITIVVVIRGFDQSRPSLNPAPGSELAVKGLQVPDEPRLQMDPVADRKAIVEANAVQINSYGQLSQEPGVERVHIPVSRAMELIADQKAPYRQEPKPAALAPADPFGSDAL